MSTADTNRVPPAGLGLRLNLCLLLSAQIYGTLFPMGMAYYATLHGTLTESASHTVAAVVSLLAIACLLLIIRGWKERPGWCWIIPVSSLLIGLAVLIAVQPGAMWGTRFIDGGEMKLQYDFTAVGGSPVSVVIADKNVWYADNNGNALGRIDRQSMQNFHHRIPAGNEPSSLALVGHSLWVTNYLSHTLTILNLDTMKTETIKSGWGPSGIAVGAESVWVSNYGENTISRFDPGTLEELATIDVGEKPVGIALGFDSIWVANYGDGTVSRVDITKNVATTKIRAGTNPVMLVAAHGAVWVSDRAGAILRIDPVDNTYSTISLPGTAPMGIAADGSSLWVVENAGSTLLRIDPKKSMVVGRPIALGKTRQNPQGLVIDGAELWVGNADGSIQRLRVVQSRR